MEDFLLIFCDGGARGNPGPAAAAFVVEKNGKVIYKGAKYLGRQTNNQAEYKATLLALHWLANQKVKAAVKIIINLDSELVVKQLRGQYKIKNEELRNLYASVKDIEKKIVTDILYRSVPRTKNKIADFLVNKTLDENQ